MVCYVHMYVNQKTDLNVLLQTDVLSIFEILYIFCMYTYIHMYSQPQSLFSGSAQNGLNLIKSAQNGLNLTGS